MSAEVGTTAPDFTLFDTDGNEFSLSSLKGKKVVLAFFPAVFSGVCDDEMCTFRDALSDYSSLNASVVAISTDARFGNAEFKNKHGLNFPVLSDYKKSTIEDYGVTWPDFAGMDGFTAAQRSVFVVGSDGKISWKWLCNVPSDLPPFDEVKSQVEALG